MSESSLHADAWDSIRQASRIVVKVGTSRLAATEGDVRRVIRSSVENVAREISMLWNSSSKPRQVILVTSGAVGAGMGVLGLEKRPGSLPELQATAAVGQGLLMSWYMGTFEEQRLKAAQILVTRDDFRDRKRYHNVEATLETLLRKKVVPIINENDTVSVEEMRVGDNDILSALVATLIKADLLIVASNVDHLRETGGDSTRFITRITPEMEKAALGSEDELSTGGMKTKLQAAKLVMKSGIPLLLIDRTDLLSALASPSPVGTLFFSAGRLKGFRKTRKRGLMFTAKAKGILFVDEGAKEALVNRGKSLLASGVRRVHGSFKGGDLVSVQDHAGHEVARGRVNYSDAELKKIRGLKSGEISVLLGREAKEVIHRDSLMLS
ncbi:MAG: glutamate 5-kinase [Candidatus Omnitrophica bacterium]|nr:glutamate 5-kinase [Candidatus Omnitrophota bacterium]